MNRREFIKTLGVIPLGFSIQWDKIKGKIGGSLFSNNLEGTQSALRLFCCDCVEQMFPAFEPTFDFDRYLHHLIELNRTYARGECDFSALALAQKRVQRLARMLETGEIAVLSGSKMLLKFTVKAILEASRETISQDDVEWIMQHHRWIMGEKNLEENLGRVIERRRFYYGEVVPTTKTVELCHEALRLGEAAADKWQAQRLKDI